MQVTGDCGHQQGLLLVNAGVESGSWRIEGSEIFPKDSEAGSWVQSSITIKTFLNFLLNLKFLHTVSIH